MRVRPGTDGALALGLANLMIERGWYDRDFIRNWSNGPHLVRADTGRLLTERDLDPSDYPFPSCETAGIPVERLVVGQIIEAKRLGSLQVNSKFEFRRLLYR